MQIVKRSLEGMEPWSRPSLKVLEWLMELFICTLAVWFMSQENRHSVKRLGMLHFNILVSSSVRQTRSHAQLKLVKVAMGCRRWVY